MSESDYLELSNPTLLGLRVIEDRFGLTSPPVLQVDPNLKWITDECRASMNAWLLEMFGRKQVAYMFAGNILMSREAIAAVRLETTR